MRTRAQQTKSTSAPAARRPMLRAQRLPIRKTCPFFFKCNARTATSSCSVR